MKKKFHHKKKIKIFFLFQKNFFEIIFLKNSEKCEKSWFFRKHQKSCFSVIFDPPPIFDKLTICTPTFDILGGLVTQFVCWSWIFRGGGIF
jgi:hypothetical protein